MSAGGGVLSDRKLTMLGETNVRVETEGGKEENDE